MDTEGFDHTVFTRDLEDSDFRQRTGVFQLVWGRDYREENAQAFLELMGANILVTGHEPCAKGFNAPNPVQIIVDCCAPQSAYVMLPVGQQLSHEEIVGRIQSLG